MNFVNRGLPGGHVGFPSATPGSTTTPQANVCWSWSWRPGNGMLMWAESQCGFVSLELLEALFK